MIKDFDAYYDLAGSRLRKHSTGGLLGSLRSRIATVTTIAIEGKLFSGLRRRSLREGHLWRSPGCH